jgi:hypothetical protein
LSRKLKIEQHKPNEEPRVAANEEATDSRVPSEVETITSKLLSSYEYNTKSVRKTISIVYL